MSVYPADIQLQSYSLCDLTRLGWVRKVAAGPGISHKHNFCFRPFNFENLSVFNARFAHCFPPLKQKGSNPGWYQNTKTAPALKRALFSALLPDLDSNQDFRYQKPASYR
jgi:hypothetical protein